MAKPNEPRTLWDEGIKGKWNEGWPPSKDTKPQLPVADQESPKPKRRNRVKPKV